MTGPGTRPSSSHRLSTGRLAWAAAGWLMALSALALAGCGRPPEPPSLVLIVVDTLRADRLGTYGYGRDLSPNLDRRAASAVVFEQAIAPSPWTLPSVASILTGRYPARHGAGLRSDLAPEESAMEFTTLEETRRMGSFTRLGEEVPVAAELLAEAGYSTAATVTNHFLDPVFRTDRGFERYDAPTETLSGREADRVVDQAIRWIDDLERPFFLLVHLFDPHIPYGAPEGYAGRYTGEYQGWLRLPFSKLRQVRSGRLRLNAAERRFVSDAYDEQIPFVDAELERLVAALLDRAEAPPTVVMLTSDHGEEFFEHGGFEHGHTVYQEILRVPLLVWAPGATPRRVATAVSLVDLAPTLLEAARVDVPDGLDGRSLWPAIERAEPLESRPVAAQWNLYGNETSAVVDWPYKLVCGPDLEPRGLYDLESDPGETFDLTSRHPELVERLHVLARAMTRPGEALTGVSAEIDEELRQELEALGYLD